MKSTIFIVTILLLAVNSTPAQVSQPCRVQDEVRGCSANGKPGQQTCDGHVWGYCKPNPPPPPAPVTGTITPRYYILTVIYAPPGTNGGKSSSTVNYASGSTAGSTVSASDSFKQGTSVTATAEGSFPGLAKLSLKDSLNWTWTSTNTNSSSAGATESASVTVGGPAFGYTGQTDVAVYYDLVYRTFLFVFLPSAPPSMQGTVTAGGDTPSAGREVIVVANGIRYRTFTDAKGRYRIYGNISGPLKIQSGELVRDLPQLPASRRVDLAVPR